MASSRNSKTIGAFIKTSLLNRCKTNSISLMVWVTACGLAKTVRSRRFSRKRVTRACCELALRIGLFCASRASKSEKSSLPGGIKNAIPVAAVSPVAWRPPTRRAATRIAHRDSARRIFFFIFDSVTPLALNQGPEALRTHRDYSRAAFIVRLHPKNRAPHFGRLPACRLAGTPHSSVIVLVLQSAQVGIRGIGDF